MQTDFLQSVELHLCNIFILVRVARSLFFRVVFCRLMFFFCSHFSGGHCIVCPVSIYGRYSILQVLNIIFIINQRNNIFSSRSVNTLIH